MFTPNLTMLMTVLFFPVVFCPYTERCLLHYNITRLNSTDTLLIPTLFLRAEKDPVVQLLIMKTYKAGENGPNRAEW